MTAQPSVKKQLEALQDTIDRLSDMVYAYRLYQTDMVAESIQHSLVLANEQFENIIKEGK